MLFLHFVSWSRHVVAGAPKYKTKLAEMPSGFKRRKPARALASQFKRSHFERRSSFPQFSSQLFDDYDKEIEIIELLFY